MILSPVRSDSINSHAVDLTRALSLHGYKVVFVNPLPASRGPINLRSIGSTPFNSDSISRNVLIVDSGTPIRYPFPYIFVAELWYAFNVLRFQSGVDTIVVYSVLPGIFAAILAKVFGKKIIFAYVDDYEELTRYAFLKPIKRILVRILGNLSDRIVCTATVLMDRIVDLCRNNEKVVQKVVYQPNAVFIENPDQYPFSPPSKIRNVFFVGGLGEWIDVDAIIALARLDHPRLEIHIIGDGPMRNVIERVAEEYGLNNIFFYGALPHNEAMRVLSKKADLCIIPFKKNRLTDAVSPIKLFEYVLLGKPVIARDLEEIKRFPGKVWIYSSIDCIPSLVNEITFFASTKKFSETLSENRRLVLNNYGWNHHDRIQVYIRV